MTAIETLTEAGHHVIAGRPASKRLSAFVRFAGDTKSYQDPLIVRLLSNAQLRKGATQTAEQIIKAVKPGKAHERFMQQATQLVQKGLQRGYTLTCPTCALTDWYPLQPPLAGDVAQIGPLRCSGCHNPITLPFNAQFAYKLNPLVREALKEGGLTILNPWVYLLEWGAVEEHIALEVKNRHMHTDIDMLLRSPQGGILVECKDNFKKTDAALPQLQRTIDQGLMLAETLGYRYIFATLQETVPATLEAQIAQGNGQLLTGRDLLKPWE